MGRVSRSALLRSTFGSRRANETPRRLLAVLAFALVVNPAHAYWSKPSRDVHSIYDISPPNIFYHNVGLLNLMVTNVGIIGNPGFVSGASAGWRDDEFLFGAGLWVGAIAADNLAYVSTGFTSTSPAEVEFRPSLDAIDTIYPSYEGVANGNRPGFSTRPDDDGDGAVDEEFLNGRDDDGDGRIDEDYAAISQQMFTCEYSDDTPEAANRYPEHRPLHLRVRQTSYAWATEGSNEFVGFDFGVTNEGLETLRQVYLGFFVDSDAGPKTHDQYWADDAGDYRAIDTTFVDPTNTFRPEVNGEPVDCSIRKLHIELMSMHDVSDASVPNGGGGDTPGYFACMFLGHTTDPLGEYAPVQVGMHTARFFDGASPYPDGDPRNDTERYDLLQSGQRAARPVDRPSDYRYCISAGPFRELAPGARLDFQAAFVVGDGREHMLVNAVAAQRIYDGAWKDVDGNPRTGVIAKETCLRIAPGDAHLFWVDPCDSTTQTGREIKNTTCVPEAYVDADCDVCTPLFSSNEQAETEGLERLVHWVGSVAPVSPATNFDTPRLGCARDRVAIEAAGDRRVRIAWDNASELVADPVQLRILFTGYRVWRAEGWRRPTGSIGPSTDEWQLIAELAWNPADGLGGDSPSWLGHYVHDVPSCGSVFTGSTIDTERVREMYPIGRYQYLDELGLKNGMLYFYDVTAFSRWADPEGRQFELATRPSAGEKNAVVPRWDATDAAGLNKIAVVPNPYIAGQNPDGWDLNPSDSDPTGTRVAFIGLPRAESTIRIFTLAGDLVQTLEHDGRGGSGTAFWNLVTRSGQDVVAGIYLYAVEAGRRVKTGRFVIVR